MPHPKRKENIDRNNWDELVKDWRKEREHLEIQAIKSKLKIDKLIFYYVDGRNFLRIYDKRDLSNVRTFDLNELDREIFLSCIDVISYKELNDKFFNIPDHQLISILNMFKNKGIVFEENSYFLALPLCYNQNTHSLSSKETQHLIYNPQ